MRNYVIGKALAIIKKNNPEYSDEKMEILEYGLTGLYILITKTVIIFFIAYLLGILKELIIFTLIYNLLRAPSFGIHASKSWICLVASTVSFISITYICTLVVIPLWLKIILGIFGTLYMFRYSPADTEKRPIVSPKRRKIYKTISTIVAFSLTIVSIFITNSFLANACILSIILQCVLISPITYKLAHQQYDNYRYYQFD